MQRRVPRTIATSVETGSNRRSRVLPLLFGLLLPMCIVLAGAIWTAPPLIIDWQVRNIVRVDDTHRFTHLKCLTLALFHSCNVVVDQTFGPETVTSTINYVFTGPLPDNDAVQILVDPDRRYIVTTDFGLEHLWNRTLTLVLGMLPFLWLFGVTFYALIMVVTGETPSNRREIRP